MQQQRAMCTILQNPTTNVLVPTTNTCPSTLDTGALSIASPHLSVGNVPAIPHFTSVSQQERRSVSRVSHSHQETALSSQSLASGLFAGATITGGTYHISIGTPVYPTNN